MTTYNGIEFESASGMKVLLAIELNNGKFPREVYQAVSEPVEASQARWSGQAICLDISGFETEQDSGEFFEGQKLGDIYVHLGDPRELVIAYGPTIYQVHYDIGLKEPRLHMIGHVSSFCFDLLLELGRTIHRTGFQQARFTDYDFYEA